MPHSEAPIFIVGTNRSGTTLLRLMLNAHPRIAIPEELLYFRSFYAGRPVESWRQPGLSPSAYGRIVQDFVDRAAQLHPELDTSAAISEILNDGPHDLRRPYSVVLDRWTRYHGKPRWGEKTPGNLFYVDIIRDMYPEARFLCVVRDPRAGVASMQKTDFFPNDIAFNALSRRKHDRVGRRLLETHVAPDHWMVVRYEDLTAHPETVLREVCTCIGEEYDPAMLAYHETSSAFMKEEAAATFNSAATQPVTAKKIDAWKQTLTDRDVALIESICAAEMRRYGYQPVTTNLPLDARFEWGMKSAYWHLQSFRNHRNRHYTVKHPAFARLRTRLRDFFCRTETDRTS